MRKLIISLFFLWGFFLAPVSPTLAQEANDNFKIDLHSTYTVNATGKTSVKQKFTITNKSPELFITKYGIVVSSTNLDKIQVTDNGLSLTPQTSKQKGQTSIGVTFDEQVLGEGKKRELIISYTDADLAQISGKILEVNIPQLSDHYQYDSYQLDLIVPNIFGNPSRISPSEFTLKEGSDFDTIHYDNLAGQAVSAIFGEAQVFDLKLNYYLENPNSQNALTQITLPPETPQQKIHYHNLDPLPKNIKSDADGNFIATYEVPANNSLNVELFAQILLTLHPNPLIPNAKILPEHLLAQKYWETNNTKLQSIAAEFGSIQEINNFVVNELEYTQADLNLKFNRLGAAASLDELNKNNATCQEFSDLFIALARINKLPARRIVGYAYSSNEELRPISVVGDVLHAWPEYYDIDQGAWIQIDPTWEDTTGGVDYFSKFDLNHITLAINGLSSDLPYPAGSYLENEDERQKKIFVDFSPQDFPEINPELDISLKRNEFYNLEIPGKYVIEIFNPTGQVWYFEKIDLTAKELSIKTELENNELVKIIPFQRLNLPISVYNGGAGILEKDQLSINIQLKEGQSFQNEFEVSGLSRFKINDPKRFLFLGGGFIILVLGTGSLFVLGRKWADSLRRKSQKSEEEAQKLHTIKTTLSENQEASQSSEENRDERAQK